MHIYTEENIVFDYERIVADIGSPEVCSVTRQVRISAALEAERLRSKEFKLYADRSIQFYADKIVRNIEHLNPDEEFKIIARDSRAEAKLPLTTEIQGKNRDILATNVFLDHHLTPGNSLEIEMEYHNLDPSFYMSNLWDEPHMLEWIVKPDNQIKEMEITIKFPEILPEWFTKSEIIVRPVPQDWARVKMYIEKSRRCVSIKGKDLKIGIIYKAKIHTAYVYHKAGAQS